LTVITLYIAFFQMIECKKMAETQISKYITSFCENVNIWQTLKPPKKSLL